jgi:hypothetical protein
MTRSRTPIVFVAAMLAVTALYLWGPLDEAPVFNAIGAAAVVALVVGARRNAGSRRAPWYLFAAGQALFVTGDAVA